MSETGFEFSRDDLLELLYDNDNKGVLVEFTKADGTKRKMLCTLTEALIPEDARPKIKVDDEVKEPEFNATPPAPPTAQRVYDLEKKAWRSFRWDSVIFFNAWE
jgi:hypothetical protein